MNYCQRINDKACSSIEYVVHFANSNLMGVHLWCIFAKPLVLRGSSGMLAVNQSQCGPLIGWQCQPSVSPAWKQFGAIFLLKKRNRDIDVQ